MKNCLFCNSKGPFNTIEHIIPESLGNDELLLTEEVCDKCQAYFGKEIELFVLNKTPIAFWRVYLGIKTKKGNNPSIDLSFPKKEKGKYSTTHPYHDNRVGFTYHDDNSTSIEINNTEIVKKILSGDKQKFNFVFTPKVLYMMSRFLCKVGIEMLCKSNPQNARKKEFDLARNYSRFGKFDGLWPIFHTNNHTLEEIKSIVENKKGLYEKTNLFSYSLGTFAEKYFLFALEIGMDIWVICLNDPYPDSSILNAIPNKKLDLFWYPKVTI